MVNRVKWPGGGVPTAQRAKPSGEKVITPDIPSYFRNHKFCTGLVGCGK